MFRSPGLRHQHTLGQLTFRLYRQVREEERGLLLGPCGVVLSGATLIVPDMLFVSRERREIIGKEYIEGPPDLVAEIITPLSFWLDRKLRRDLYAKYGVRYYWLVEPIEEWVRAYELGADGFYELVTEAHGSEQLAAPPFSDISIALADLWDIFGRDNAQRISPPRS